LSGNRKGKLKISDKNAEHENAGHKIAGHIKLAQKRKTVEVAEQTE